MSQATIVFNDPRQLYAGTAKFDGSLEERKKFKEDFEKVCKKVNKMYYFGGCKNPVSYWFSPVIVDTRWLKYSQFYHEKKYHLFEFYPN